MGERYSDPHLIGSTSGLEGMSVDLKGSLKAGYHEVLSKLGAEILI